MFLHSPFPVLINLPIHRILSEIGYSFLSFHLDGFGEKGCKSNYTIFQKTKKIR